MQIVRMNPSEESTFIAFMLVIPIHFFIFLQNSCKDKFFVGNYRCELQNI